MWNSKGESYINHLSSFKAFFMEVTHIACEDQILFLMICQTQDLLRIYYMAKDFWVAFEYDSRKIKCVNYCWKGQRRNIVYQSMQHFKICLKYILKGL